MDILGPAKGDLKTKNLIKRLKYGDIAVIQHPDLDELAGIGLRAARVKAVINAEAFITGKYPNLGPQLLAEAGIILVDSVGTNIFRFFQEGDELRITPTGEIYHQQQLIAKGRVLIKSEIIQKMTAIKKNMGIILESFVQNTLEYAQQEQSLVLGEIAFPQVRTNFAHRHTLIVVRGKNYREDLQAIMSYIKEIKPVLVGVDGGADALAEFGLKPDIIIGDMDSVSDKVLACGAELIVHAYCDGRAPGLKRVSALGLEAKVLPAPGTSEDIAMLMAYEFGTELIAAVGTHSNMIDFLEKGRRGMASTFLVRLKVGSILVDARGVSKLYGQRIKVQYVFQLIAAALVPLAFLVWLAPSTRYLLRLAYLQVKVILGI